MIQLIQLLFIGVAWTWGVHVIFQKDYLLEGAGKLLRKTLPELLSRPLFDCPVCMSSIHGSLIFFILGGFTWKLVFVYVICLAGINFIIVEYLYPSEK